MKRFLLLTVIAAAIGVPASAMTGDVNGDGTVNITDVNLVINSILADSYSTEADVNHDGTVNVSDVNQVINLILGGGSQQDEIVPKEIALDFSDLTEPAERIPDDEDASDYGDYVENTSWSTSVNISFDGETATVTGNPSTVMVSIEGAHVTVTSTAKRVRYVVTGSTSNGSLKFYSERKFQLLLNGADITNPNGAAINNQCGKSLYLVLNVAPRTPCATARIMSWSMKRTRRVPSSARGRYWSAARVRSTSIAWAGIASPAMTTSLCARVATSI